MHYMLARSITIPLISGLLLASGLRNDSKSFWYQLKVPLEMGKLCIPWYQVQEKN